MLYYNTHLAGCGCGCRGSGIECGWSLFRTTPVFDSRFHDPPRQSRWNRAAQAVILIKPKLADTVRMLAKIDADLHDQDVLYRELRRDISSVTKEHWDRSGESIAMAHLWVLGAYELIHTIDQHYRAIGPKRNPAASPVLRSRSNSSVSGFPLPSSKLESGTKPTTASPTYVEFDGRFGLEGSETTVISRNELSSAMLAFLERLRAA